MPLLFLSAGHTTRPAIQVDKANMHFSSGNVTTSGMSQAKGLEQTNEQGEVVHGLFVRECGKRRH